ncbi:MAG: LysR family transcriptional regulator [Pseudohongiellaceae bacterium]
MKIPRITLEQWAAFKSVVDHGSFAAAAEVLSKSQSSVSYAVSRINASIPRPVLRVSGRKAVLTPEGEVLYRYATQLLHQADETEAVAQSMALGFEAEVTLALDALLDVSAVICTLERFSINYPHTRIRILETSLSGTTEALLEKKADIVVGSAVPTGYMGTPLKQLMMMPVAAPNHPLVTDDRVIDEWELKNHRQVVLRDTGTRRQVDAGWLESEQRWTVSHFSSSVKLVKSGLAFAFLPRNWVVAELESGQLAELHLAHGAGRNVQLYLMVAKSEAAGPATKALAELLREDLR